MAVAAESLIQVRNGALRASTITYGVLLFGLVAFWPSVLFLGNYWLEIHDYRHGFLVVVASAVWLVAARRRINEQPARPVLLAAMALLIAIALWLVAFGGSSAFGQQVLIPPTLFLAVLASAGSHAARASAGPLTFLYFAVPVWDYMVPTLQRVTVLATETGLALLGVPAVLAGSTVTIPAGTFQIAEGCSGKRFFVVTLAVACLVGVVMKLPRRKRLALIGAAAVLSLIANWIRVIIVIYAGHLTAMRHYFVAVEHFTLGWAVFAVLMLGIVAIGVRLAPPPEKATDGARPAAAPPTGSRVATATWVPFGLLVIPLAFTALADRRDYRSLKLGSLPVVANHWQGPLPFDPAWQPNFVGNDAAVRAAYRSGEGTVEVYVNLYEEQHPGQELVYYLNDVIAPGAWHSVSTKGVPTQIAVALGRELAQVEAEASTGERWVVAYVYEVGGIVTRSPILEQFYYGAMALTGGRPSGVLAFAARCDVDCDRARRLVAKLWQQRGQALLALIPDYYSHDDPSG